MDGHPLAATTATFLGGVTPTSSPNALKVGAQGGGTPLKYATWGTADTNGGDVSVQASFNASASTDQLIYALFARCNVSAAVLSTSTFYTWEMDLSNLNSKLIKTSSGVLSTLATVSSISLSALIWYTATLSLVGSQIAVSVQRSSDSKWLTSSGTWQTAAANVHSLTDSSITGSGYAGLAMSARSDTAYSDDWSLSAATAPVTVALAATGGNDAFAGAAADTAKGILSSSGGNDTFAGLAPITTGMLSGIGRNDTAALTGTCIVASLAATEHHDTFAGTGSFTASGGAAITGGNDAFAGAGAFKASGALSAAAGNDAAAIAGNNTILAAGTLLAGGSDVFAGAGTRSSSAAIGPTERHDTLAGSGGMANAAVLAATERHDAPWQPGHRRAAMAATERHDGREFRHRAGLSHLFEYRHRRPDHLYSSPIATTGLLTRTVFGPLALPRTWRFGVRAYDTATMLEEENLDAAVTIILDAAGIDITNRPKAPTALRAFPRAGGTIRVEWAYNTINLGAGPDRVSRP